MSRNGLAWKLACVLLGVFALARPSAAIELELPGERKMEIHGFYEMRLSVVGPDAPPELRRLDDRAGPGEELDEAGVLLPASKRLRDRAAGERRSGRR